MKQANTPEQIRAAFIERGQTITQWAAQHGYDRNKVYQVLGGQCKGKWGQGHEIAVLLGLKPAAHSRARKAAQLQGHGQVQEMRP